MLENLPKLETEILNFIYKKTKKNENFVFWTITESNRNSNKDRDLDDDVDAKEFMQTNNVTAEKLMRKLRELSQKGYLIQGAGAKGLNISNKGGGFTVPAYKLTDLGVEYCERPVIDKASSYVKPRESLIAIVLSLIAIIISIIALFK